MAEYLFHPIANVFPMLDPKELAELADDIAEHGQREPIILFDDMILDGRNRYRACVMAGVEPLTKDFIGDDPLAAVWSANYHRRHMDASQLAMAAAKYANLRQGARTDLEPSANLQKVAVSQGDAAEKFGVSTRSVASAAKVLSEGVPELAVAVTQGEASVSAASKVATLPKDEQRKVLAAGPAAVVEAAKATRKREDEAAKAKQKEIAKATREALKGKLAELAESNRDTLMEWATTTSPASIPEAVAQVDAKATCAVDDRIREAAAPAVSASSSSSTSTPESQHPTRPAAAEASNPAELLAVVKPILERWSNADVGAFSRIIASYMLGRISATPTTLVAEMREAKRRRSEEALQRKARLQPRRKG
jgi:ParB-like chromosome segregation protein Spo0J